MSVEFLRKSLLWCAIINYAIILIWFFVFVVAQDSVRELHGRFFRLSPDQFGALNYLMLGIYKMGVLLFNVVPCIVLYIMGRKPATVESSDVGVES
jgi:hypothetical protein